MANMGPAISEARALVARRQAWLIGLGIMIALVIACYAFAMNAYWVGDDFNYVRPKDWDAVLRFFNPIGRAQFRPLTWNTWALDFALFGTNPLGWHLTRLVQHIWNAVVAALLVRAITGKADLALLAATLFALHPAQPETITWLGGEADASFAMLWLPALWLFVLWRQGKGKGRMLWVLSGLLGFLSLFGKEAAITLPIASLWIDILFGREWTRWPARRDASWWRDRPTVVRLLRDHSLFIASSAAYVIMRLALFFTGQGALMYGSAQLGFLQHSLDVAVGYMMLSLGLWWVPQDVYMWALPVKLALLAAALVGLVLLVRWLGKVGLFAVGWIVITLLLTLQAVALRWFYLPALGVGILVAAAWVRLRGDQELADAQKSITSPWKRALMFLPIVFVVWFGWQTVRQNEQWQQSSEVARDLLAQVKQLHPNPRLPATFYVANPPYSYDSVLLFNTGFDSAMSHIYNDWTNISAYNIGEDTAQVETALSDPTKVGPNPIFLRYEAGKMVDYPDLPALVKAGK